MTTSLEYRNKARTSPLFYAIFAMGVIVVFSGFAIDPSVHCVEYPCPFFDLSADDTLVLVDSSGQPINFSNQCIPFPYDQWAQSIQQTFPHIEVLEK